MIYANVRPTQPGVRVDTMGRVGPVRWSHPRPIALMRFSSSMPAVVLTDAPGLTVCGAAKRRAVLLYLLVRVSVPCLT